MTVILHFPNGKFEKLYNVESITSRDTAFQLWRTNQLVGEWSRLAVTRLEVIP